MRTSRNRQQAYTKDLTQCKIDLDLIAQPLSIAGRPVPLKLEINWNSLISRRLERARKMACPRVDRRTSDWRHYYPVIYTEVQCRCISQKEIARQLDVSQSHYSRVESGKVSGKGIDIGKLYSVFGDALEYVLTGEIGEKLAPKPRRRYVQS